MCGCESSSVKSRIKMCILQYVSDNIKNGPNVPNNVERSRIHIIFQTKFLLIHQIKTQPN